MTHTAPRRPDRPNTRIAPAARRVAIAASMLASLTPGLASAQTNGGFERPAGRDGQVPGWFTPPVVAESGVTTRSFTPEGGAPAGDGVAEIVRPAGATIFGQLMQGVDPAPYRGMRVELSATIRVEQLGDEPDTGDPARAQLWIRVDREGRARGFFDNTQDRPVLDNGRWNEIRIVGEIHPDATAIYLGVMTFGHSRVLVDDVELRALGPAEDLEIETPVTLSRATGQEGAPLTDASERALMALGNAVGYARWFSPADGAVATDWDRVLVGSVPIFERFETDASIAEGLADLLGPVLPGLAVWTGDREDGPLWDRPEPPVDADEPPVGVVRQHTGMYSSELVTLTPPDPSAVQMFGQLPTTAWLPLGMPAERELVPGLWMRWTVHLPVDAEGRVVPETRAIDAGVPEHGDRAVRIASVLAAASVLDHFFPYAEDVSTDFDRELDEAARTALRVAAETTTTAAHVRALRAMLAITRDGHGGVYHPDASPPYAPPFVARWVCDDLVITRVLDEGARAGLERGDVVLSLDGAPIAEHMAERMREIPGSPQWQREIAASRFGASLTGAPVTLGVRDASGRERTVEVDRVFVSASRPSENRPENFEEIAPGIVYVDLTNITQGDLDLGFDSLSLPGRTPPRGLVLDIRGYPSGIAPSFLTRFTRVPVRSADWVIPTVRLPDRRHWEMAHSRWLLEPSGARLDAELVFLMDARAISYSESILGLVEGERLGTLVGSPTAGANGNVVTATLPGQITMAFTGMRVLKHDGARHHITGVLPHIPVEPTIEGVRTGRDEVLDAGVRALLELHGDEPGAGADD